jgi:hypothetical protein
MSRLKGSKNKAKTVVSTKKASKRKYVRKDNDEFINIIIQAIDNLSSYGKRRVLSHLFTKHIDLVAIKNDAK